MRVRLTVAGRDLGTWGEGESLNPKDQLARVEAKPRLDLLEPVADEAIAAALADGLAKYGHRNYAKTPVSLRVYLAAIRRHVAAYLAGEDDAPDSGLHHLAHVGANVHVILAAAQAGTLVDDRFGDDRSDRRRRGLRSLWR